MTTVQDFFGLPSTSSNIGISKEFICGSELEIESIKDPGEAGKVCQIVTDHSLRNNGFEFIYGPVKKIDAIQCFKHIHSTLKLGKEPFSERTSIHVHVNCRTLDVDQTRQLILVYALLEPLFFDFVGDKRKNNIFCVPLNFTFLPNHYARPLGELHKVWSKYAAFNICPLGPGKDGSDCHGTIEFRHMYGTADVGTYTRWLNILEELHQFIAVKEPNFNIIKYLLQSDNDVVQLAHKVVPTLCANMPPSKIKDLCKDTLIDVKLSSGGLTK